MKRTSIPKLHSIKFKSGAFADNVLYSPDFARPEYLPVNNILEGAMLAGLKHVVLVGIRHDGSEYIAGTFKCHAQAAYLFGRGELDMLRRGDEGE